MAGAWRCRSVAYGWCVEVQGVGTVGLVVYGRGFGARGA